MFWTAVQTSPGCVTKGLICPTSRPAAMWPRRIMMQQGGKLAEIIYCRLSDYLRAGRLVGSPCTDEGEELPLHGKSHRQYAGRTGILAGRRGGAGGLRDD